MLRKCLIALGAMLASGWAAHAAPLEAYGKLPNIEQATVSPSGKLIAYVVTNGEARSIAIQTSSDHKLVMTSAAGTQKVRDLTWAGDDHLILTTSTTIQPTYVIGPRVEYLLAQDLDLKRGRPHALLEKVRSASTTMNVIVGYPQVRTVDGKPWVFVHGVQFVDNQGRQSLFRINLDDDAAEIVEPGGHGAYDWAINGRGEVVAQALYDDPTGVWKVMVKSPPGGWRTAQTLEAQAVQPDLAGMGRDGKSVLLDMPGTDGAAWRELSLETGGLGERSMVGGEEAAIHDPANALWIGKAAIAGDEQVYTFFDPRDQAAWRGVAKAFAGDLVTLESWSDDHKTIMVRVDSAELGPAYSLIDRTAGTATWIGPENEGLKAEDISPVKPVRYKAADGTEITGYLTLPRGRDAHGLPLIVLPHGGPAARDTPGYDWWSQALASRGYAVLRPNFRGSTGLGQAFHDAGLGEFGRKMQTDLSDGARSLVAEGVVDPKRICIVGASYGGYAALAGAAFDHGVYRCAVAYAGPSDLRSQFADSRAKSGRNALRYWERFVGAKDLNDPVLAKISPASHAAEVDVPVLLIHGRDDTIVPFSQSLRMADALKRAGKPVELVALPGEDHWLSTGATRLQMLQATVAFLEKNNPPN